jgi:hypothetical protein
VSFFFNLSLFLSLSLSLSLFPLFSFLPLPPFCDGKLGLNVLMCGVCKGQHVCFDVDLHKGAEFGAGGCQVESEEELHG